MGSINTPSRRGEGDLERNSIRGRADEVETVVNRVGGIGRVGVGARVMWEVAGVAARQVKEVCCTVDWCVWELPALPGLLGGGKGS